MKRLVIIAMLAFSLGCTSQALIKQPNQNIQGSNPETAYSVTTDGAVTQVNPSGQPVNHSVIDSEGGDMLSQSPISALSVREFALIQTVADLEASDVTLNTPDGLSLTIGELGTTRSDPLLASAELQAALAPILQEAIRELQETIRNGQDQTNETIRSGLQTIREGLGPVPIP